MTASSSCHQLAHNSKRDGDPKMIGLWKIGRTIGKGSSGRVRLARHTKTGQYAAVKIVSKTALLNSRMSLSSLGEEAERILHSIEREIVIMKLIDHPNIMRLYDVWETSTELYLILEYVEGGELFDYLCNKGRLSAPEALTYFHQIITAIDYCHRFNIAHRDLKPENLLLDRNKNIKVADFGMAVWQGKDNMLQTACGSPHYAAPEVIMGDAYDGTASDIWSCGIILYALLAGRLPFDDEDLPTLLEKVKIGKFTMPSDIDPRAQDLIRRMVTSDVRKRITIPDILRHPFYTSQKPKPMSCDIPKLDEIARPLGSAADIDADIFANLRTLWRGMPDAQIIARLTDPAPSWEKGVYHLLVQYRAKHTGDYDEEEESRTAARRTKRRKARRAAEAEEREQERAELPPRTGPPTPSRAGARMRGGPGRSRSPSPSPGAGPSRAQRTPLGNAADPALTPMTVTSACDALSPTLEALLSPRSPLAALNIPEVEDVRVQQFLQQIVQHLAVMKASTGDTPHRNQTQDEYDELFAPLATTPVAKSKKQKPQAQRQFGDQVHGQVVADDSAMDPFEIVEIPRECATRPLSVRKPPSKGADKENTSGPPRLSVKTDLPGRKSSQRSGTTTTSDNSSPRTQLLSPSGYGEERGRLRKRSPALSPASPASAFSEGSFVLPSTPRRRWFGALTLFRARPTYRLLSTQDAAHTHATCRRLLESMGVTVASGAYAAGSDALVLACTLTDVSTGAAGSVMAVGKGVRFRAEIRRPGAECEAAGYPVMLQLALEKGAAGSLKLIYARLRREWDLDSPPVPMSSEQEERFVQVVYAT
ncbi:Pkinase-domain-containing protein [Trametes versicolor FP-101664 SS1]|uniref:Pkinase-domain-containing protein n=1 Tax=Trametes versicolor (strain FP-101664) TaxID=717944 RepID=UPI00046227B3|nr:Pkinase-domain-containing protein [Trametes versicolor FP-101664 SS1]EIW58612.1 Pkinase-domain-containing protein [Trametes versicolor FP-101664 SS1]